MTATNGNTSLSWIQRTLNYLVSPVCTLRFSDPSLTAYSSLMKDNDRVLAGELRARLLTLIVRTVSASESLNRNIYSSSTRSFDSYLIGEEVEFSWSKVQWIVALSVDGIRGSVSLKIPRTLRQLAIIRSWLTRRSRPPEILIQNVPLIP